MTEPIRESLTMQSEIFRYVDQKGAMGSFRRSPQGAWDQFVPQTGAWLLILDGGVISKLEALRKEFKGSEESVANCIIDGMCLAIDNFNAAVKSDKSIYELFMGFSKDLAALRNMLERKKT